VFFVELISAKENTGKIEILGENMNLKYET
jgi:hypothetical protein